MSIFTVCGHIRMIESPTRMLICDAMVMIQTADILINAGVPPQQRAAEAGTTLLNTSYRRLFVLNKLLCLALHSAGHCSAAVPQ